MYTWKDLKEEIEIKVNGLRAELSHMRKENRSLIRENKQLKQRLYNVISTGRYTKGGL